MKETHERLVELIAKMDERGKRADEVIEKFALATLALSKAADKMMEEHAQVTREYIEQINKLQECRDRAIEQNQSLITANKALLDAVVQPRTTINNN